MRYYGSFTLMVKHEQLIANYAAQLFRAGYWIVVK